ncbi:hypothetical protein [Methanoregula sp.]|jgi:hypothetical protein|nr:hypothetical protein [Methanoregula sp.]
MHDDKNSRSRQVRTYLLPDAAYSLEKTTVNLNPRIDRVEDRS